jgi:hypothetical protein
VCYWLGVLRRRILPGTLAFVGVLLLYGPWLQRFAAELDPVINGMLWYFTSIANLLATHGTLVTTRQLFTVLVVVGLVGVVLLQLLAWKVASVFKRRTFSFGVSIAIVMSTLYLAALVASVWPRGYGIRRQVLIFVPYFLLIVVLGIRSLKWRMQLVSGLVAVSLPFLMVNVVSAEQQDWRSLAIFMTEQAQPEDVILFSAPYYVQCMEYYYRGSVERVGVSRADVPSRLSQLTQKRARVWLVLMADVSTDPGGAIPAWLSARRSVVGQYSFAGVQVWLYGAPG